MTAPRNWLTLCELALCTLDGAELLSRTDEQPGEWMSERLRQRGYDVTPDECHAALFAYRARMKAVRSVEVKL